MSRISIRSRFAAAAAAVALVGGQRRLRPVLHLEQPVGRRSYGRMRPEQSSSATTGFSP